MRQQRFRFVGGPLHGELRVLPEYMAQRFYAAEQQWLATAAFWRGQYTPDDCPTIKKSYYEIRDVRFGHFAGVSVMAFEGMSEAEFMRRIADILEGVGGK